MMAMRQEAQIIEQVCSQHGVLVFVQPPPASYETSTLRIYCLRRGQGVPVSKVTGLIDELDEALTAARGQAVRCRFDRLPLRLEVPRPDAQVQRLAPVLRSLRPPVAETRGRLLMLVGEGDSRGNRQALLLDLTHPNSPHVLVAGTTGSGKTNLLAGLILSLTHLHGPQEMGLVVLDPKGVDLGGFAALPHLATPVVADPVEAVAALRAVVAELERRKQAALRGETSVVSRPTPRLVVVVDELADLMDVAGAEVEAYTKRILQVGRGLGIHVIAATQKPLAAVIGSLVKANFPVRLVGKVASSDDARVAAGLPGTGAERLPGLGSFLLVHGGDLRRFQSYHLPNDAIPSAAAAVRKRWQGKTAQWRLPRAEPSPSARTPAAMPPPRSKPPAYPSWLKAQITAYIEEHGTSPSLKAVQRAHKQETGRMLNWDAIRAALADAEIEMDLDGDLSETT